MPKTTQAMRPSTAAPHRGPRPDPLSRHALQDPLLRRTGQSAVVQRHVTFNPGLEAPAVIGVQGLAGYDLSNVDSLVDALNRVTPLTKRQVTAMLGRFLDEGMDICFKDYDDAAAWVATQGKKPEAVIQDPDSHPKRVGGREIVYAYRAEGQPKSAKQSSDVKGNVTPRAAFTDVMEELSQETEIEQQQVSVLESQWSELSSMKDDKRKIQIGKIRQKKGAAYSVQDVMTRINTRMGELNTGVDTGDYFASRVQIDGSNMISSARTRGKVTGLSTYLNFSVGSLDHASYFISTFSGKKGILIRFALDKAAWREWKNNKTGPVEKQLGPSSPNTTTTMNDVTKPGVIYEMNGAETATFYDQVVVKTIPAAITTLEPAHAFVPSTMEIQHALARLAKAQQKLQGELVDASAQLDLSAEVQQSVVAGKVLESFSQGGGDLEALYTAMSLTKNALHSVRRKKAG